MHISESTASHVPAQVCVFRFEAVLLVFVCLSVVSYVAFVLICICFSCLLRAVPREGCSM